MVLQLGHVLARARRHPADVAPVHHVDAGELHRSPVANQPPPSHSTRQNFTRRWQLQRTRPDPQTAQIPPAACYVKPPSRPLTDVHLVTSCTSSTTHSLGSFRRCRHRAFAAKAAPSKRGFANSFARKALSHFLCSGARPNESRKPSCCQIQPKSRCNNTSDVTVQLALLLGRPTWKVNKRLRCHGLPPADVCTGATWQAGARAHSTRVFSPFQLRTTWTGTLTWQATQHTATEQLQLARGVGTHDA